MTDLHDLLRRSEVTVAPDRDFATNLRELCHDELAAPDTSRGAERPTLDEDEPIVYLIDEQQRAGRGREKRSGRRVAIAAAAAVALIVGATVLVRNTNQADIDVVDQTPSTPVPTTTTTRPPLPKGLTFLPPEGATPSTPDSGQLLASLPMPIWIYEDGRVISARFPNHNEWTRFLEQRLSPSGVELVRAEILALEPGPDCGAGMGNYGYLDGARTVGETPGNANLCNTRPQNARLAELPYGGSSWLPASAWLDPEPKPYVPTRYHLEIDNPVPSPVDTEALLATISPEVGSLLTRPTQCPFGDASAFATCFEVTTDEARDVAAALGVSSATGHFRTSDDREYAMWIGPYLPHGTPVFCCGG
jgi:hypothetical protein